MVNLERIWANLGLKKDFGHIFLKNGRRLVFKYTYPDTKPERTKSGRHYREETPVRLITYVCFSVGGGTLFERIAHNKQLTEADCKLYVKQILEGVYHMHSQNICHLELTVRRFDSIITAFSQVVINFNCF